MKNLKIKARCEHILETALEMFATKGYAKTNLCDIIKKSGGSLSTLYENFGSKEGLLKALIESKTTDFAKNVIEVAKEHKDKNLEEFLSKVAKEYIKLIHSKHGLELKRIVMQENTNKHVAKVFCDSAMKPIFNSIISFFEQERIAKLFVHNDFNLLTFRFLNLLEEPVRTWGTSYAMLTGSTKITQDDKWIKDAIAFFLNGAVKK